MKYIKQEVQIYNKTEILFLKRWKMEPSPGGTATVSAAMTPDEAGLFSKTIDVHCNVAETPLRLTLAGAAN
jgi:hypothetical protein